MKKLIILFILVALSFFGLKAQIAWPQNGSNIYYNGGNVGIGTTGPACKLHIIDASNYQTSTGLSLGSLTVANNYAGTGSNIVLFENQNAAADNQIAFFTPAQYVSGIQAQRYVNGLASSLTLNPLGGNVGIGTINPATKLEICSGLSNNEIARFGGSLSARGLRLSSFVVGGTNEVGFNFNAPGADGAAAISFSTLSAERMRINYDGNIGIGTTAPQGKLDLGNGTGGNSIVWGGTSGTGHYASIGTMYSSANLVSGTGIKLSPNSNSLQYSYTGTIGVAGILQSFNGDTYFFNQIYGDRTKDTPFDWSANTKMIIKSNGSIGIGTTNPNNYKLAVEGTIAAREVKVTAEPWADFVFHPTYKLRTLGEVEQFIKINSHLPEIPTAAEVKENGVSLGEMNTKLLQKVEELTLYLIEMKKDNEDLKNRVSELEKKQL